MTKSFDSVAVSIVLFAGDQPPTDSDWLGRTLRSALKQDHPAVEVLVVDGRGPDAGPPAFMGGEPSKNVRHLRGTYENRAAKCNAALAAAKGTFLLIVDSRAGAVVLRRSAVRTMVMAAVRHEPADLVYGDYELHDPAGRRRYVHPLDWHAGRLRDTTDFGRALLFRTEAVRNVGGFDEELHSAETYDMRLKLSESGRVRHIANRSGGSLYTVFSAPTEHNVFDYLMADRAAQMEREAVLAAHLKRIGAFLAPGAHIRAAGPRSSDTGLSAACVASVVIPVNHRPAFIGAAIESVWRQTVRNIEAIIVVNGGEADPTIAAVQRYQPGGDRYDASAPPVRLLVVDVNNIGMCLNAGIAEASGEYYVQLDSDDRLKPDAVEKLLAVFKSDPTVGMVIGSYEVWNLADADGAITRDENVPVVTHEEWTPENGRNNLLRVNGAGAPRAARIAVIKEMGWFSVNDEPSCRNYGEDYDLVLRLSEHYAIGRVWDPIYEVIRHSGGTDHAIDQATIDRNDEAKDHMRLEALERRRRLNANDQRQ